MRRLHGAFTVACTFGLALVSSGAPAQNVPRPHEHPDVVFDGPRSRPVRRATRTDSTLEALSGRISTTPDNQILVELAPEDTAAANLFDLNGRTLVFTPDGHGGYSRSVRSVAWEDNIGPAVADGAEVQLQSFMFDFAGRRWSSFLVSRRGVLTFGGPLEEQLIDVDTMREIAGHFVTTPTISPLYKPFLGGLEDRFGATQHVATHPDRVVVSWKTSEAEFHPDGGATFQAVLSADGRIRFSYHDVSFGDGIVGLFPNESATAATVIARIPDQTDTALPGHLDLTETAIYESNVGTVIVEFSTRGAMPDPDEGSWYSYRLHFDAEPPYFAGDADLDMVWQVDIHLGDVQASTGRVLPSEANNRIALDVGPVSEFSGMVRAGSAFFRDDGYSPQGDDGEPTPIDLPAISSPAVDLSRSDSSPASRHSEVFHYLGIRDVGDIACRVVDAFGDEFDVFAFHSEFRSDIQWAGMDWTRYGGNVGVEGVGDIGRDVAPCGKGRLKGHWSFPYWMKNVAFGSGARRFDPELSLFAHEFTHAWTASASYDRDGARERLFDEGCRCHWRQDLHLPAAFPWREDGAEESSLMGGGYWRDNGDGTYTPLGDRWARAGHSWLDLYLMGLADANEVPDMFILRNLKPVRESDRTGPHTGEKERVSIDQVIAAEGPREPPARQAQKVFNAAFVYLLELGQMPDDDLLRLHSEYRDKVVEYWSHVTGGRSQITTTATGSPSNAPPVVVGRPARPFTDHPIVPGVAPVKALHFTELRTRIDALRGAAGLEPFPWTDPVLKAGVTPVRLAHLLDLRKALAAAYAGRAAPGWTDALVAAGVTAIKAAHIMELRNAVLVLESGAGTAP